MTDIRDYYFPPALPDPTAADCTRDDLLTIAADACRDSWPLAGSREHVERICADYVLIDSELRLAREERDAAREEFAASRALHAELVLFAARADSRGAAAETLRCAALADADQQRRIAVRLSEENAVLRLARAADTVLRAAYLDRMAQQDAHERKFDLSDSDTVVAEVGP